MAILLLAQVIGAAAFAWRYIVWSGWEQVGPDAFPGSPDAALLYENARWSYQWSAVALCMLWGAGLIALLVSRRLKLPSAQNWGSALLGRVAVAMPPVFAFAVVALVSMGSE